MKVMVFEAFKERLNGQELLRVNHQSTECDNSSYEAEMMHPASFKEVSMMSEASYITKQPVLRHLEFELLRR